MRSPSSARPFRLWAIAAALSLALDALGSRIPATTPPYLLLAWMDEAFRGFLNPVGVSIGASVVNGAISTLLALALENVPRGRAWKLALALAGLWLFSGGLLLLIYVHAPAGIALGSLAAALPRAAVVAWALDRAMARGAAGVR